MLDNGLKPRLLSAFSALLSDNRDHEQFSKMFCSVKCYHIGP